MTRVRSLHSLRGAFSNQLTSAVDLSDILRAEIVLTISALDHFVHELARLGMLECWEGSRKATEAFGRFTLPISIAAGLANSANAQQLVDGEIRSRHGFLAFQHPDKIADAVRLFSEVKLWEEVGHDLGVNAKDIKTSLVLIVDRRNKIAHEADIDPSYPGQRWPIDASMVEQTMDKIESIARSIFKVAV